MVCMCICNLLCDHCSVKAGKKRDNELTFDEIKDLVNQIKDMEIFSLFISGGECFLRRDILDILNYIDQKDIDCFVQTNGLLLTEDIIKAIPKSIYLVISFDGINSCNKLHKSSFSRGIILSLSRFPNTFNVLAEKSTDDSLRPTASARRMPVS